MQTDNEIIEVIKESTSLSEVLRKLSIPIGGGNFAKLKKVIEKHNVDVSHFNKSKYSAIEKCCPSCGKTFETTNNPRDEKSTCSYSCSNRYFRTKNLVGKFNTETVIYNSNYRTTCLNHYGHKCAFCDWILHIEVHHIDRNRENNDISNLIPLCANHHSLTKLKDYRDKIDEDIKKFKEENP